METSQKGQLVVSPALNRVTENRREHTEILPPWLPFLDPFPVTQRTACEGYMAAHTCNLSMKEAEAGGLQVEGWPE